MRIFISLGLVFILAGCNLSMNNTPTNPGQITTPLAASTAQSTAIVLIPSTATETSVHPTATTSPALELARSKIKHVIVIMQENRSFDQYFGTYPGANGIPRQNGVPTVCSPDPQTGQCIKPYHDSSDINAGGPHSSASAILDIDGGKMDGFVTTLRPAQKSCENPTIPGCAKGAAPDVMGWHDAREIPNYWAYAQNFVLQDMMFEPNASWSLPAHLFMVSA